jgi:hypothetical protein
VSDLTYTLLSDGSSDSALMPVLDWVLRENGVGCAIQRQWADLRRLRRPPTGLAARLKMAIVLFPCDLLFVHRDAEGEPYRSREEEIRRAAIQASEDGSLPALVPVIPVRMREAWLLFDERAIRRAAGNPSGEGALNLPDLGRCEDLPDPKDVLRDILREASGLSTRRRARLPIGLMMHRIAEYAQDFAPLRALAAFTALERELRDAITTNGWDQR